MYWKDNHGNIYGPYSKQEDGFPNAGEVIRHSRKLMGLSQKALALLLGVTPLWITNMENHNQVPELLSRRRVIADLLNIPPVLLGMSVIGSDTFLMRLEETHPHTSAPSYSVQEANEYLDTTWEAWRFTGSLGMLPGVRRWKARIEGDAVHRGQNLDLLLRYEHFLMRVGKNRQDYTGTDPTRLIDLAEQINDPDTLGISLYRRGGMYFIQQNYKAALADMRKALSEVGHAGPQVKSLVLACSGPVLAHDAADKADVREIMDFLDKAYKYRIKAKGYPDPFHTYTTVDTSGYFLDRAYSIIPLLRLDPTLLDEAFETLDLAQQGTKPQYIRRRATIEVLYAEATFYAGEYLSAAGTALEALELAQSIDSIWSIKCIQMLYEKLAQTKIKDSSELRKLKQALTKK